MKAGVLKNIVLLAIAVGCLSLAWVIYTRKASPAAPSPPMHHASTPAPTDTATRVAAPPTPAAPDGVAPARSLRSARENPRALFVRAAEAGDASAVRALLADGVDAESRTDRWPPLLVASAEGHEEVVKALLEAGVDVNRRGPAKWTALMMAGANDRPAVVRALLEAGAHPLAKNELGATFFDLVAHRRADGVRSLLAEPAYRGLDTRPLIHAVCRGDFAAVQRLFDEGVSVDGKDADGLTPLQILIKGGTTDGVARDEARFDIDMVRLLLDRGANLEAREPGTERTPLMDAIFGSAYGYDAVPVVTLLLDRGASLEVRDNKGRTPIELAVLVQQPDQQAALTKLILERAEGR